MIAVALAEKDGLEKHVPIAANPAKFSPEMRAQISTEKPLGSKDPAAVVVLKPEKGGNVKPDKRPR